MEKNVSQSNRYKSVSWQFLNYLCSFGMNFVVQIVLARLIAPEEFGALAILNTIIFFADIFVQSGISTALVQKKELRPSDIFSAQIISGLTACLFVCLLFGGAPYIAGAFKMESIRLPLQVMAISLIFNSINSIFSSLLIRRMAYKKLFFRTVIVLPIAGIVGVSLAILHFGLWALVAYQLTSTILNSFVYVVNCEDKIELRFSKTGVKEMYSFGIKVLFTGLISSIYDTVKTLVIGGFYSKSDLAFYDRGQTYSKYTVQIAHSMISSVALPILSQVQDSRDSVIASSRKIVGLSSFVMFPLLLGVAGISRPFILVLLTDKWSAAVPYLMIFCLIRMPGIITMVDKQMFFSIGRSDIILKYTFISLVLNLITLVIVIPYGVLAIAINTLVVEIIVSVIIAIMGSKVVGYSIKEKIIDLWKPFFNSLVMFAIIMLVDNYLIVNNIALIAIEFILGASVYIGMAVITKDENVDRFKVVLRKFRK